MLGPSIRDVERRLHDGLHLPSGCRSSRAARSTVHVECEALGDDRLLAKLSSTCLIRAGSPW